MTVNHAPERRCAYGCGNKTRTLAGICARCRPFETVGTRTTPGDALTGGRWVTVRGVQRWLTPDDEVRAYALRMSPRLRQLLTERYADTGAWWTKHGDLFHDKPDEIAQRLRDLADDFDRLDGRSTSAA